MTNNKFSLKQSFVLAGCLLGAGYVSGQELWQYFGSFGNKGYWGLILTLLLIWAFGSLVMVLARQLQTGEADKILVPWEWAPLRAIAALLQALFLFGVFAIMSAGVGALLNQVLGLPHFIGCAVLAVLVLLAALSGLSAVVKAFSSTVPVLVLCTVCFAAVSVARWGFTPLSAVSGGSESSLLVSWPLSAVNYMCFSILAAVPVLAPLAVQALPSGQSRRQIWGGNLFAVVCLAIVALSVLTCVAGCPESCEAELPMLYAAAQLAPWASYLYALMLLLAMFGTALSSFVGFVHLFAEKFTPVKNHQVMFSVILCFCGFAAGLCGFGTLIGTIYPIFGYAGALFVLLMVIKEIQLLVKQEQ